MPTDSPLETSSFQIIYDQILQETFTTFEEGNNSNYSSSYIGKKAIITTTSPVYFENLFRPPHITLFWKQNLNGKISCCSDKSMEESSSALEGLIQQLQSAHEVSFIHDFNQSRIGKHKKLLIIDEGSKNAPSSDNNLLVFYKENGKSLKQIISELLFKLVREYRIKSLFINFKDDEVTRDAFLELQDIDKAVIVVTPEFAPASTPIIPFKLANVHYEMLNEFIVVTGEPRFASQKVSTT